MDYDKDLAAPKEEELASYFEGGKTYTTNTGWTFAEGPNGALVRREESNQGPRYTLVQDPGKVQQWRSALQMDHNESVPRYVPPEEKATLPGPTPRERGEMSVLMGEAESPRDRRLSTAIQRVASNHFPTTEEEG